MTEIFIFISVFFGIIAIGANLLMLWEIYQGNSLDNYINNILEGDQ